MKLKNHLKRTAAVLLSLVFAGSLAGCGGSSEGGSDAKEKVPDGVSSVKVCMPNYDSPAETNEVAAAVNEIAEEKYGVHLDIEFIATGNWTQQTNLMLTSDEVDVLALYGTPFSSFVNNGQLLDLTEYWENAGDVLKAEWTEKELQPFCSGGKLYAIPNFREYGGYLGAVIDEDIAAEFGITHGQKMTWEEVDEFLQKAHEKYPERYGLVPTGGTALISNWTWDGMGDTKYLGVLPNSGQDSTTVQNLFDTEDFKNFTGWARKWYDEGITMPDILSNTESWKSMFQADKAIAAINTVGINKFNGLVSVYITDAFCGTDVYQMVSYGINANSKNPDASWKALEALYTDKEIGTLIANGIEGKHYVLNEDGTASYPEGVTASTAGYNLMEAYWFVPYCPNSYPSSSNGNADLYQNLIKQKDEAVMSKAFGFAFDSSPVVDEYTACSNVMDKYYKALMSGAVDPEKTMKEASAELEAAGIDKIIEEKQKQLDNWLSEQ